MHFNAAVIASLISAACAHVLRRTDTCYSLGGPSCTDLVIGQKDTGKQICTSISGTNLIVSYPAVPGYPYSEVHVYLGTTPPSTTAPGQFPFTSGNGYCTVAADGSTATCTVPISSFGTCGGDYYIATHSAQGGETGWGKGQCINDSCHPWAMYWGQITINCRPCSTTPSTATPPASTTTKPAITSTATPTTSPATVPSTKKPSTMTSGPNATPTYPACWTSCWTQDGVDSIAKACSDSSATQCIQNNCPSSDWDQYESWMQSGCPSTTTTPVLPVTPPVCTSTSSVEPTTIEAPCKGSTTITTNGVSTETKYTTTVITNYYPHTTSGTTVSTYESTCKTTSTYAPATYTTTCAA